MVFRRELDEHVELCDVIGRAVCVWLVDNKLLGKTRVDSHCLRLEGVANAPTIEV